MAIRDFGNSSFNFTFVLLSLDTFLDTSCLLLLLSNPRNPMALSKYSQRHCCDVIGFKPYLYSPIRFSMLAPMTLLCRGGNSWNSEI